MTDRVQVRRVATPGEVPSSWRLLDFKAWVVRCPCCRLGGLVTSEEPPVVVSRWFTWGAAMVAARGHAYKHQARSGVRRG